MMFDAEIFGEALTVLRGNRSQRKVARSAGIPTGTWCQWEKGKRQPRDSQIPKILAGLKCSEDRLRLECCRIQIRLLQIRGSGLDRATLEAFEKYRPELAKHSRAQLLNAPSEVQTAMNRLQRGLTDVSKQVSRLQNDLEAAILAIEGSSGKRGLRAVSSMR